MNANETIYKNLLDADVNAAIGWLVG